MRLRRHLFSARVSAERDERGDWPWFVLVVVLALVIIGELRDCFHRIP